jgi:transcription initiation factor TFIIIB Brf1 subunit/transcription initiation factor TFIIB
VGSVKLICPNCGNRKYFHVDAMTAEIVCLCCGLVVAENVEVGGYNAYIYEQNEDNL